MSAVATPPARPTLASAPLQVGPPRVNDGQTKHGPMRNLPSISRTMTTAEADQRRQTWVPPNVFHGEYVFYRASPGSGQSSDECMAVVTRMTNKTFDLTVLRPNFGIKNVGGVAYYDHNEDQPELTCDPKAPFNNNGTFRRTEFGKRVADFIDGLMNNTSDLNGDILALKAAKDDADKRIAALENGMKNLLSAKTAKAPEAKS